MGCDVFKTGYERDSELIGFAERSDDFETLFFGFWSSLVSLSFYLSFHIPQVEPDGFDDTSKSIACGKRVRNLPNKKSICDALLAEKPGNITFNINKINLTSGVSVSDDEALIAMNTAYKHFKIVLEPGGAVALAAILAGKIKTEDKVIGIICSGGNIDKSTFRDVLDGKYSS